MSTLVEWDQQSIHESVSCKRRETSTRTRTRVLALLTLWLGAEERQRLTLNIDLSIPVGLVRLPTLTGMLFVKMSLCVEVCGECSNQPGRLALIHTQFKRKVPNWHPLTTCVGASWAHVLVLWQIPFMALYGTLHSTVR
jgi:hypothetical protein